MTATSATAQDYQAPAAVNRLQARAGLVGVIALVIGVFGWVKSPAQFYPAYLMSYMLVLGFALGALGLLMLQHLTSGYWGIMLRRPAEAASRTLPLLLVLFLPIPFGGFQYLYTRWTDAAEVQKAPLSQFEQSYLTVHGFWIRAAIYFAVWLALMAAFNVWSRRQDVDRENRVLRRKLKLLAGPGIILYVFGISFAAIDWVMSINPHWASTIYGFLYVAGQLIASMSLVIITVILLARAGGPLHAVMKKRYLHDLSKLLFAFLLLWAYFSFSNLLIIWSGNQPDEISFFLSRYYGFWGGVSIFIVVFHFFVPFFLLLSQGLKRNPNRMIYLAIWMILVRLVDLFWLTHPDLPNARQGIAPMDIVLPIALTGIWLAFYAWQLKRMPLLPLGEPKLPEVVGNHEH